jgi:CRP-like cAMP-binding protein/cytochrome P450
VPVLGNTIAILRDVTSVILTAYRDHGPAFRLSAFGHEYTIMAGREAMEFLSAGGERHFSRAGFYDRFARELGTREFILSTQGPRHRQLGKCMRLGFSRQVAEPYIAGIIDGVRARARSWTAGRRLAVPALMADLGFDAYSLVMAGAPQGQHFADALVYSETIMRVGARIRPPLLLSLPRYRRARRRVFRLMHTLLEEHRAQATHAAHEYDLFHVLLDQSQADPASFTDADIIATALYGFVGTQVYLNRVLSYLLYELLKDAALKDEATAEADALLGGGAVTAQSLRQLRTLRHAYLESLRVHPVAIGLPFLAEEDFEFCGSLIRRGDKVVVTPLPAHFSPGVYTNAHRFDCGRCAGPHGEIHAAGAFAPFGFDGRVCAAVGLVEVISLTIIATLLHMADLRLEPPDYVVRTILDPLPGPEPQFTVTMAGLRSPAPAAGTIRMPDEVLGIAGAEASQAWKALVARVERAEYPAGASVIREGDPAEHFFILTHGQVEVFRGVGAEERRVALLGPGDFFGEIGLLRRIPRTASVRAATAAGVLVVDRETFVGMIAESDFVSEQIADSVRRRMTANRLAEALPHLDRHQIGRLLPNVQPERYAPGAVIIRQGDPADRFFVLASGRVEVVHRTTAGHEHVVNQLEAGEWFGETGLLLGAPRSATVRVTGDTEAELLVIGAEDFRALLQGSDATRADVWAMMARRLADLPSIGG